MVAPAYANIFMAYLWKTLISPFLPVRPFWIKRFMDDIVAIFHAPFNSSNVMDFLNTCHPTIKFTASPPAPSVSFLDITILICDNQIHTDLYSKPSDSHLYLSPKSCHPKHIFRSVVYSGGLRLRRICSKDSFFTDRLLEFSQHLLASGYKQNFIKNIFSKVSLLNRPDLLKPSKTIKTDSDKVTFITTYHPNRYDFLDSHKKHEDILKASSKMANLFPCQPRIAFRRPQNLGNLLVKTKHHKNPIATHPGFFPCGNKRCLICKKTCHPWQYYHQHSHWSQIQYSSTHNLQLLQRHLCSVLRSLWVPIYWQNYHSSQDPFQ